MMDKYTNDYKDMKLTIKETDKDAETSDFSSEENEKEELPPIKSVLEKIFSLPDIKNKLSNNGFLYPLIEVYKRENQQELQHILESCVEEKSMDQESIPLVTTGFKEYDNMYYGLWKKELMMIAAPAGIGKTILTLNMISNIQKKYRDEQVWTVCFSLSLKKRQIMTMLLSMSSGIDFEEINKGNMNWIDYSMLKSEATDMSSWPIIINDDPENVHSIKEISKKAREYNENLIDDGGVRIILIDYLQLIDTNQKQDYKTIVQELKTLAEEVGATVILLSSLPEPPVKRRGKKPKKEDIDRYLGEDVLEQLDTLLLLYRKEYYYHDCLLSERNMMEVQISKNYYSGKKGKTIKLRVDRDNLRITDFEEDSLKFIVLDSELPFL